MNRNDTFFAIGEGTTFPVLVSVDGGQGNWKYEEMIFWAFVSFAVALTSGLFGFGGQATLLAGVAQTLFFVFLALALVLVAVRMAMDHESEAGTPHE